MKISSLFLAIFFLILSNNVAYSQGDYLQDSSGFEIAAGVASNDLATGGSLGIGYSPSGAVDIGVAYSSTYYSRRRHANMLSLSLAIYGSKSRKSPLSAAILLTYDRSFSSYGPDGNLFGAGMAIYSKMRLGSDLSIEPAGSILFAIDPAKPIIKDNYRTIFSFDLSLFLEISPCSIIRIDPGIAYEKHSKTTFGLTLGYILPIGK